MPALMLEFEVFCDVCGGGLCNNTSERNGNLHIESCENCLDQRYTDGYDEGYDAGVKSCDE